MTDLVKLTDLDDGWIKDNRTGEVKPTSLPVGLWVKALKKLGNKLSFNLITLKPELNGIPFQPDDMDTLYCHLGEFGYSMTKQASKDGVLYAAMKNSYNPVVKELNYIETNDNITPVDIDNLASEYLGTNDPLYDEMLAVALIGAVARAFEHGCQMDYVICLKGEQGLKKSDFWRVLAGDYFCETQQEQQKDLRMAMNCCWIFEYPEIECFTRQKNSGSTKSLITQRNDDFRPPFASSMGKYPRKSILVGSLNENEFLVDKTGSRRFYIIDLPHNPDIGEQLDIDKLTRDRERIFKAAIIAHRNGRKPMLPLELQNESNRRNIDFEHEHPYQRRIETKLKQWGDIEFSIQGLIMDAQIKSYETDITQTDINDVAAIIKRLGYKKTRQGSGKSRARLWKRCQHQ